jgi:hypothetical protein
MNFNDVIYQSAIKVRSTRIGGLKSKWMILKKESSQGPLRLEIFTHETACEDPKTIELRDFKSIKLSNTRGGIDIETRQKTFHFCVETEACQKTWWKHLNEHFKSPVHQFLVQPFLLNNKVATPSLTTQQLHTKKKIRQDSLATFHVYLLPGNVLCNTGECLLLLNSTSLSLVDLSDFTNVIIDLPYTTVRNFGGDSSRFTIETGSRSVVGEGLIVLNTVQGEEIYEKVIGATRALQSAVRIQRHVQDRSIREKEINSTDSM